MKLSETHTSELTKGKINRKKSGVTKLDFIGFLVKVTFSFICEKLKKYSPNRTGENSSALCVILADADVIKLHF